MKVEPKEKKEVYELGDAEFCLVEAIQELAKEVKALRLKLK